MPRIGVQDNGGVKERNVTGSPSLSKKISAPIKSPRSPLSPQRRHRSTGSDFSLESLDIQSCDQSPSRHSFGSSSKASSRMGGSPVDKKLDKVYKFQSASTSPVSSGKLDKPSHTQLGLETSSKSRLGVKSPHAKPPVDKKTDSPLKKQNTVVTRTNKAKSSSAGRSVSLNRIENSTVSALDKPELAPVLLKQARDLISLGDSPQKALELALQAMKLFDKGDNGKPSLELVMCLHVTAAIYCILGQYNEAISILEHSIKTPVVDDGQQCALAKFASHMQLGDAYAMLGQLEKSITCYTAGLELQKQVLGETDPRVGETCRYVAEANIQALQFDEAEMFCQMTLDIHRANGSPQSLEEAVDRRLMGLICENKGNHEAALEHLVLASMAMVANGQEVEVATVDCSIGDIFLSLARYDEASFAYQKALTVFKANKGDNHPAVGSVFVRLANLYNRMWKIKESKSYCESALRIYENPMPEVPCEEIASGFTNVSAIYESMNELEHALKLLHKALEIYNDAPGQQRKIAGIEAQIGVMYYTLEKYAESYNAFKNAISKLRAIGEKKSVFFSVVLNQTGLACVQCHALSEAAELFEEAGIIMEHEYGPYHPETLAVYSNLAGTYDALGRVDDAIENLEYIVVVREEKLGTANADVVDEKRRLNELLKENGRVRNRKLRSLEKLLDPNGDTINKLVRKG
ncbi:hypothetical protein TanjilG_29077 [Lupinus angustifolius]|uniref:MalT-like TPR region domain-containing protein n=1 Tax=Lupinus angustifolius TaxID=3871 RepID=A0A4P1RTL2_LUPAN|nr:PREDICTED: protein KINESIN LIGHT CHAIN-RELATED 3-like [Lupinus angustifolius]XP_019464061.1 PREDICTED: protein KINESIN LIGHT CHAIN-RELATED 3-like [Lupinus angustifolius]OIW17727.1 hypothetical protein TanjilG_29077 [Lupinus angustifolius]